MHEPEMPGMMDDEQVCHPKPRRRNRWGTPAAAMEAVSKKTFPPPVDTSEIDLIFFADEENHFRRTKP
jgi:hypothetical protein